MLESKQEYNPLEEMFEFCDKNFTKMTEEECDELIRRVRAAKSTEEEPTICEVKAGKYKVCFRVEQEDDGSYFGYCPQLKGCVSDGETLEELRQNLEDAAILYINSLMRHGEEIPAGEYVTPIKD